MDSLFVQVMALKQRSFPFLFLKPAFSPSMPGDLVQHGQSLFFFFSLRFQFPDVASFENLAEPPCLLPGSNPDTRRVRLLQFFVNEVRRSPFPLRLGLAEFGSTAPLVAYFFPPALGREAPYVSAVVA